MENVDLELRYPQWQRLLDAAILEFDPQHFCVKLQEVEAAISTRLQELASEGESQDERRALAKALFTIRILEKNRRVFLHCVS
jgi:hypothetical protein